MTLPYKRRLLCIYKVFRRIFFALIFFQALLLSGNKALATHSSGADLQYRWISGRTFEVTVSFYRDCDGVAAPGSITLNARSSSCNRNQDYTLNLIGGTGQEITFPCISVQTVCSNSGSIYAGYEQYVYRNNITLPQNCSDWILSFYVCCRNCAISTLNNPCSDNLYVEALLNNVAASNNSSPRFTNIPVAFICINQNFTYNHGVIDPNGDSLVYSFVSPKKYNTSSSTVGNVTFKPGFSATSPITSTPSVAINSVNGDITMRPTVNGEIGVTAILVREYRNGVLIGSVIRDMQFLTRVCNPNFLPAATGINGTVVFSTAVCPGNSVSFTINSSDPNPGDSVAMFWNDAITGATFNTTNALLPVGTFSWTPTLADARQQPYTFTVTVRDNSCPLKGSQTYGFTVYVPMIEAGITSPSFSGYNIACRGVGSGTATATATGGGAPYAYVWNPSGQTTQTATSLPAGSYTVTVSDTNGCPSTSSITLIQPPSVVSISINSTSNASCDGASDGIASVSGGGGVGPYTYLWTPSGQTTSTATGLSSNIYTARVTDANGCIVQQSIAITDPALLSPSVSSFSNVTCLGNANGYIKVTVAGGTSPFTHSWSNGASTDSISGLAPGTYTDTVRDSKGCLQIISQVITQPGSVVGIPTSAISTTDVTCFGLLNGTANVNPVGGTPPYSVSWSNGDIGNSADSLASGSYNVNIVDGNGCSFDTTITISQPAVLNSTFTNISVSPSGTNIRCNGDTTGRAKVLPTGGTSPYTYSWSNSSTADSIYNEGAGVFTVLITDSYGCTFSDTVTLTQPTPLNDSLLVKHVGCKGEPSGGIRTVTYGGSPLYSYAWSNGVNSSDTIGDLFAGFYQVSITDTNNCQVIDTVTIVEPDTLVPLILPSTFIGAINITCNGDSTGSAVLNVFGGTRPFSYLWSTSSVDSFVTGLPAGLISVRVVDSNGCSMIRDTILTQPSDFSYSLSVRNPLCYGDSAGYIVLNTSGSVGPYTYVWSNSATTDSVGNLNAGVYYVIVKDANNCEDSTGYTLVNPDSLIAFALLSNNSGFNNDCRGDSSAYINLNVTGGTGSYTYLWNTGSVSDSIGNLTSGTYSVTIFDSNGCREDTSVTLTQPALVVPSLTTSVYTGVNNVRCYGYIDGYASVSVAGGVPPYQFLWSNGDVADSALGLGAGNHSVTITDDNGCITVLPFTFIQPAPLTISPTFTNFNGFNVACYGDSTACITVGASGGSLPYLYVWEFQDTIVSSILCNLPADSFSVRIIDANGCQLDTSFILTSPLQLSDSAVVSNYSGFEIQCSGLTNGNIDLNMQGGVIPLAFNWSTGDTTEDILNLGAGTYQVIVTDLNSCSDTLSFTLDEPPAITDTVTMTGATCSLNNGSGQVTVTAGLTPFTYLWNPSGITNPTAPNIPAGWYTITVTDSVGCTKTDSILVVAIPVIGMSFSGQVNNICPGGSSGSLQVSTLGGTPPFSFLWSNGDTTTMADSLPAGYVTAQVTDGTGCIERDSVFITEPSLFVPNYIVNNAFCAGLNNGSVQITLTGGTAPFQFSWSNGDTGPLADSLGGGYVTVNFTDQNGCTGFDSVNVVQLPAMVSTIASISSVSCNGAVDGSVTVTPVTGGAPPYDYNWSNGDSGLTADSLPGGTTTLTITDVNSCTIQVVATINEPAPLLATTSTQTISCDGQSDGVAVVSVSGGTLPYSYAWSPVGGNGATASGLDEGSYSVSVTDFNNCIISDSATIGTGDCDLELPTGFTPNGDGKNDFFVIHGLSRYPDNALKVFNRWGNEVLSVENYSNTEWYGQNNDGENLPDGTYFVIFKVSGQDVTRNSFVELKR